MTTTINRVFSRSIDATLSKSYVLTTASSLSKSKHRAPRKCASSKHYTCFDWTMTISEASQVVTARPGPACMERCGQQGAHRNYSVYMQHASAPEAHYCASMIVCPLSAAAHPGGISLHEVRRMARQACGPGDANASATLLDSSNQCGPTSEERSRQRQKCVMSREHHSCGELADACPARRVVHTVPCVPLEP
jgi:hypothetical protein